MEKTENEINVSGKRHTIEDESKEGVFILIEASKLSLDDVFMQYKPHKHKEKKLKRELINTINIKTKDFWIPKYDPSFREDGEGIAFEAGKIPAVGQSSVWWIKTAEEFSPERHSRLGFKSEYVAFLGVLIKKLVSNGWTVQKAWNAVCIDSKELGHYCNSNKPKFNLEKTGCREILEFCDLANTYKILLKDGKNSRFLKAGGMFLANSFDYPLSNFQTNYFHNCKYNDRVGWIVCEK